VFPKEIIVGDGSERAEPEVTEMLSRRREEDLVHWCTHRLHNFWREVVEPDQDVAGGRHHVVRFRFRLLDAVRVLLNGYGVVRKTRAHNLLKDLKRVKSQEKRCEEVVLLA